MTNTTLPHAVPNALVFGDPQLRTDGDVLALAFASDGTLWSVEEPGLVRQWNPSTGQELAWHSPSELEDLWCFSNDARVLASAANDLALWDAGSGTLLTVVAQPDWVTALTFAPDATFLATGHDDGAVRHWDASTHHLVREFCAHDQSISAVAYSPDCKTLAAAGEDRMIHLWDLPTGRHLGGLEGHTDRIPALVWHPDGRHLISAGWDTTARIWDTHKLEPVILLNAHAPQVQALSVSGDGALLACGDSDNAVHVWDLAARKVLHVLRGTARDIRCMTFTPDGKRLAFGGGDHGIHFWDTKDGKPLAGRGEPARSRAALALSPDGQRLAGNGGGSAPCVWRVADRQPLLTLEEENPVHALAWSPDGKWVAGGTDPHGCIWDAATGKLRARLDGQDEPTTVVAFSRDSRLLATAGAAGMPVWIWDVATGEPVLLIPDPLDGCNVESLAFHPEKKLLAVGGIDWMATGGSDGAVSLWDLDQRCEIMTYFDGATAVAFDAEGTLLAVASVKQDITIYEADSERVVAALAGHEGLPTCLAFSPDGKILASGGEDRMVRLWDVAAEEEVGGCELDTQVKAISFSPDGRWLFTANANTTCYQFEVQKLLG